MKVEIYSYPLDAPVSEQEYRRIVSLLSEEKRQKLENKPLFFRKETAIGEAVVRLLAVKKQREQQGRFVDCHKEVQTFFSDAKNLTWRTKEGGKPYLAECPHFHFSVSHSGKWLVCAVAEEEIGVDIEKQYDGRKAKTLAERFFTKEESSWLWSLSDEAADLEFQKLWTMKESYLKYTGRGLSGGLDTFTVKKEEFQSHKGQEIKRSVNGKISETEAVCGMEDWEYYRVNLSVREPEEFCQKNQVQQIVIANRMCKSDSISVCGRNLQEVKMISLEWTDIVQYLGE